MDTTKSENKILRKDIKKEIRNPGLRETYEFIKILTGSDLSSRKLPVISLKSKNPGPIIWLTGGVHGDEIGGVVVIQEIFKRIRKMLVKGEIHAIPLMNPMGFENVSRSINLSEEDMNRSFPGNENGTLAERIAFKIMKVIRLTKPNLVLDLHNDWRNSIHYAIIDPEKGVTKEVHDKTKELAKEVDLPIILDAEEIQGTLTFTLLKEGVPSFALELGESNTVNEKDVERGVNAIMRILIHLGMIPVQEIPTEDLPKEIKGKVLKYSPEPTSSAMGILRFLVKPGKIIKKGELIATVQNAFGKKIQTIKAIDDALVLGYSDYAVSFPGAPIMAFGIL